MSTFGAVRHPSDGFCPRCAAQLFASDGRHRHVSRLTEAHAADRSHKPDLKPATIHSLLIRGLFSKSTSLRWSAFFIHIWARKPAWTAHHHTPPPPHPSRLEKPLHIVTTPRHFPVGPQHTQGEVSSAPDRRNHQPISPPDKHVCSAGRAPPAPRALR